MVEVGNCSLIPMPLSSGWRTKTNHHHRSMSFLPKAINAKAVISQNGRNGLSERWNDTVSIGKEEQNNDYSKIRTPPSETRGYSGGGGLTQVATNFNPYGTLIAMEKTNFTNSLDNADQVLAGTNTNPGQLLMPTTNEENAMAHSASVFEGTAVQSNLEGVGTIPADTLKQESKAADDVNNSTGITQTVVSSTEAAVSGSPTNKDQETNKLSVPVPTATSRTPAEVNSCFDAEYICRTFGYTLEEIQSFRGLENEAGVEVSNPFPLPEICESAGEELWALPDLFRWYEKHINAMVARGTDAYQDIVRELKRTATARNGLVEQLVKECEFVETLVSHWKMEPKCGCPPKKPPRKTRWKPQKAHKNMPPNLTSLEGVGTDFVARAFGLSPEKIQRLRRIRAERAKAGIDEMNPFPFSERGTDGKEYWEVSDFIGWHEKYLDTLVAKGVSAFQDVVNELETTISARNAVVLEMLVRFPHLETLAERWKLEQKCDCGWSLTTCQKTTC